MIDRFEGGEAIEEFAPPGSVSARFASHLAQHRDHHDATGGKSFDQLRVEPGGREPVAHEKVDRLARGQAVVEIVGDEPTPIAEIVSGGEVGRPCDGDSRDVDADHIEAPNGEPHRAAAVPAGHVERTTGRWEMIEDLDPGRRRFGLGGTPRGCVATIPVPLILSAHGMTAGTASRQPVVLTQPGHDQVEPGVEELVAGDRFDLSEVVGHLG